MRLAELEPALAQRFDAEAAGDIHMRLRLTVDGGNDALWLHLDHGRLTFGSASTEPADATFYFDCVETARSLLLDGGSLVDAFMHGRFRADGYIVMAFQLMSLFSGQALPSDISD